MRPDLLWLPLVLLALASVDLLAQAPGSAVQLPTYSTFGATTTVTVPDRGSAFLGGVSRAATGRNEFGVPLLPFRPFTNRGIGMERSAANMHVTAYIHDFDAMDEYLLSQPTRRFPYGVQPRTAYGAQPRATDVVRRPAPTLEPAAPSGPASMSVADLRAKHLQDQQTRAEDALRFFERGKKAEAAGKQNVARIYYQMAARRASGELKSQVAARLELIDGVKVAQNSP
jgi:hypothetical protein